MSSYSIEISNLSKYRTQLMGVSALMILLCHAAASGVLMPKPISFILSFGELGVDMFLFLSGLGCYYSLLNNDKYTVFFKKRLIRILTPYFLIVIPFDAIFLFTGRYTIAQCILNVTTLDYWLVGGGAWFIALIIPLYICAPILFRLLRGDKRRLSYSVLFITIIVLLYCIPVQDDIVHRLQKALIRVPNFIIGMSLAPLCFKQGTLKSYWLILFIVLYIIAMILHRRDVTIWCLTPILLYTFTYLLKFSERILNNACLFLGSVSLECYLTNININSLLLYLIPSHFNHSILYGRYIEYTFVLIIGLVLSKYVNAISKSFIQKWF